MSKEKEMLFFKGGFEILNFFSIFLIDILITIVISFLTPDYLFVNKNVFYILICFFSVYVLSIFMLKIHLFYSEYLLIIYPTRILIKQNKIIYDDIEKIKYIKSTKQYRIFISYKIDNKFNFNSLSPLWNKNKLSDFFSFFDKKGIDIFINNFGDLTKYNGKI